MWIFDRKVSYGRRKPHLFPSPSSRDQKVNLSKYKKIRIVSSCGADKLMLRLHRVVVLKVTLGFT